MARRTIECFLVIAKPARNWQSPKVRRVTVNKPRLESEELAVKLRLTVDDAVFAEFIPIVDVEVGGRVWPPDPVVAEAIEPVLPDDEAYGLADDLEDSGGDDTLLATAEEDGVA